MPITREANQVGVHPAGRLGLQRCVPRPTGREAPRGSAVKITK